MATDDMLGAPNTDTVQRDAMLGSVAAVAFIAFIVFVAGRPGLDTILFPELGALAYDVFRRPRGAWARAPVFLTVTPFVTAMLGTLVTRHLDYGVASVLVTVGLATFVVQVFRSPIAPAISAALLPLTLGETTWWYPPSILVGTGLLAVLAIVRSRVGSRPASPSMTADDVVETAPHGAGWIGPYAVVVVALALAATLSGWRFLLFPPLAVIGFEMLAHPAVCPWAKSPLALPVACTASAAAGLVAVSVLGGGVVAAAFTMALGALVLLALRVHIPPALAVGLLPFVIEHPSYRFIIAVAVGASLMTAAFVVWRRLRERYAGACACASSGRGRPPAGRAGAGRGDSRARRPSRMAMRRSSSTSPATSPSRRMRFPRSTSR